MKRSFMPNVFKNKRFKAASTWGTSTAAGEPTTSTRVQITEGTDPAEEELRVLDLPSDTKAALVYLRSIFNVYHFESRIPPILLKHQLYSIIQNKTQVDREVDELREKKEIKLFRFGKDIDEFCIVFTEDYVSHVRRLGEKRGISSLVDRFIPNIVEKLNNITFTHQTLSQVHGVQDTEITQLVNAGMLTVRDVGSVWLSIPGAGLFMKSFAKGRQSLLRTIKKSRYKEILQKELEARKLQAVKKLGMAYHIHDIIGAELVTRKKTTSGTLLRVDS